MSASKIAKATGLLVAAGAFLAAAGPASADEVLDAWSTVSDQALDTERGRNIDDLDDVTAGTGAAINIADQTVVNHFNVTGDVASGDLVNGSHTFANQTMSINAFNTGNNVTMLNQLSIQLNLSTVD